MFGEKKYKLLKSEVVANHLGGTIPKRLHRIKALRDIPRYGVKKGDVGGYVLNSSTLSHFGDCWIGGHAQVLENAFVTGDAYVGDNAIVDGQDQMKITVFDNAKIIDNAAVTIWILDGTKTGSSSIYGNFEASGNARIINLDKGFGNAKVYGDALVRLAEEISGSSEVYGNTQVLKDVRILGKSKIYDYAIINKECLVIDSIISGHTKTEKQKTYTDMYLPARKSDEILSSKPPVAKGEVSVVHDVVEEYNEVIAGIDSYEKDIVKLIKYPVMTDSTDPYTLNMVLARKKAKRLSKNPQSKEFAEAVADLEAKFTIAESNALKLASTKLTEVEQKKTEKAKDLLAIAANESSSENEKVVSFKQAFKQLEGVISVPEVAVDAFRIKIGVKELEQ